MQILLTAANLRAAVLEYVQNKLILDDEESLQVDLTDEGAIVTVLAPGLTSYVHSQPVDQEDDGKESNEGDKPKRTRRTKAQIEADRLAEEAAAEAAKQAETQVTEQTQKTEADLVDNEVQEPLVTPEEEEDVNLTLPDEQKAAEPVTETAASQEVAQAVAEEFQGEAAQEVEQPKPTQSLFANLRNPRNS